MAKSDKVEIPVVLSFPWSAVSEVVNFLQVTPEQAEELLDSELKEGTLAPTHEDIVDNVIEAKIIHSEYDEELQMLRVRGLALMPGVYTGMNGLTAEYSHEVIRQDGLDLTGRPVGAMHIRGNSGYVEAVEIEEISAYMYIDTLIYDASDIAKIENRTYTGFSIDTKVWGRDEGNKFVVMKIGFLDGRVDLVDRPACEDCLFLEKEIVQKEVANMTTNITEEELKELREAKKDLMKLKVKQAAEKEVRIVKLIEEIKTNHPTFDADEFLKAGKDADGRIAMLKALKTQLPEAITEEPKKIGAPDVGSVMQIEDIPEIEIDSYDVKDFIRTQFREVLRLDDTIYDDPFKESFDALLEEEARALINASG